MDGCRHFPQRHPQSPGTGNIPGKKLTAARAQSIPGTGVMPGTVLQPAVFGRPALPEAFAGFVPI